MAGSDDTEIPGSKNVGSDLLHLMATSRVSNDVQAKFYLAGVDSVRSFAALVSSEAELRELLKTELNLPDENTMAAKVKMSKVIVAWEVARTRTTKMAEMDGEAEIRGEPKMLAMPDYQSMKTSFEGKHWDVEEKLTPSKHFMEKRLEMIEKSDLRAESLTEVVDKTHDDTDTAKPVFDSSGQLRAVKVGAKVPLPENPEQLRERIELYGNSWIFASFVHTNRVYLIDVCPRLFD